MEQLIITAARREIQIAEDLGTGKTVVTLLPDTGERYLDFPI